MNQSNNGKKTGHRFQRGNKFGTGRPVGSRNRATVALQAMIDDQGEAVVQAAIQRALAGDTACIVEAADVSCLP
jgi:hypothetical protein